MPNMITPSTIRMCGRRNRKVDGQKSPIAEASTTHKAKYPEAIDDIFSSHLIPGEPGHQSRSSTGSSPQWSWEGLSTLSASPWENDSRSAQDRSMKSRPWCSCSRDSGVNCAW